MILGLWDKIVLYLGSGGLVMTALIFAAGALWYGLGFRMLALRRGNKRSVRVLIDRFRETVGRKPKGIIDAAIMVGLAQLAQGKWQLRRRLDEAFALYDEQLSRFRDLTHTIVVIAPLLGLLGTVVGMVETFESLGRHVAFCAIRRRRWGNFSGAFLDSVGARSRRSGPHRRTYSQPQTRSSRDGALQDQRHSLRRFPNK